MDLARKVPNLSGVLESFLINTEERSGGTFAPPESMGADHLLAD